VVEPIDESTISRVLIALNAAAYAEHAVNAALAVAQGLRAELAGLFVEDVNLLRLAQLPFALETGVSTAASRPLEIAHMQRALRHQAQTLERLLAAAAKRSQLPWSFAVARGHLVAEAFAQEADLILLAGMFTPAWLSIAGATPSIRAGPVIAVVDASPAARRALGAAMSFASQRRVGILVTILAESSAQFELRRQQTEQWLAARGGRARYLHIARLDAHRLLELVGAETASCLVLPQVAEAVRTNVCASLLARIDCPLFIAR
jgi:nucleotide-binding universal stress UspA family protein